VKPDLMSVAKGITSAYFPVGAALVSEEVAEVFEQDQSGNAAIWHGYTYSAHPVGAAAVTACLSETLRLDTKTNAAARGTQLYDGLMGLKEKYDIIGDVRGGHGLMTAIEFVSDRATKTPLDADTVKTIQKRVYEAGAMVRPAPPNIMMSPPLIITEAEVQIMIDAFDTAIGSV
jgi:adenosylmethionine-8-amino-7-oxononanoate aminotransferase